LAVALGLLGIARPAEAQGWLADRKFTQGPGIRTGDFELHPGIGGEVGYDSNWFLRSSTEGPNIVNGGPNLPPQSAVVFRVTPSFSFSTLTNERLTDGGQRVEPRLITFRAGASATARFFIGDGFSNQHNVGLNADARLDIAAGRPLAFGVFGGFNRIVQPQVLADPNLAFTRNDIRVGGEVTATPGGGTFDVRALYQLNASLYETSNGAPFSSITHEVIVRDRWKFRPRTALFSDVSLRFINYPEAQRATFLLSDSTPLRTRIGISGLVTQRFGVLAAVGYGATFFKDPTLPSSVQFDSITGQAEGTFYLGQGPATDSPGEATLLLSSVSLGFARDFQTSLLGNFYNYNRLYARLEYWFGGRVLVNLTGYGEQLNYPPAFSTLTTALVPNEFTNYRVGGALFAEYRFTQAFAINTTLDYSQQISDTQLPASTPAGFTQTGVFDLNYRRFQAFLGVRYFY